MKRFISAIISAAMLTTGINIVYAEVPITFTESILGTKIQVAGINENITVVIPEFTQTGDKITVKGKGTKILNKNGYGDLIAKGIYFKKRSIF